MRVLAAIEIVAGPGGQLPVELILASYRASARAQVALILHGVAWNDVDRILDPLVHAMPLSIPGVLYVNTDDATLLQETLRSAQEVFAATERLRAAALVHRSHYRPVHPIAHALETLASVDPDIPRADDQTHHRDEKEMTSAGAAEPPASGRAGDRPLLKGLDTTVLPCPKRRAGSRRSQPYLGMACAVAAAGLLVLALPASGASASENSSAEAADQALKRAVRFFRDEVAVKGSYVWEYSADLKWRRGEGVTTATQGWVQAPGTPAVGLAYLKAYEYTKDRYLLDAAVETARALTATQLESGGWWHLLEFDPAGRAAFCYRLEPGCRTRPAAIKNKDRDASILDDDMSQGALRFLMLVDSKLQQRDADIHTAVIYGLTKFAEAQYPNGAWPFRFDRGVDHSLVAPRLLARYPAAWPRTYQKPPDTLVYILNDNIIADAIRTFLLAFRLYGRTEYLASAVRGGDFLLAAQLPAPQRGWAQVYDETMQPIWGRKFEPPAVASRETKGAIDVLLELYTVTQEQRFLKGATEAATWLRRSMLDKSTWARFYELKSNRPLYMTLDYKLTYQNDRVPKHYSFNGAYGLPETLERVQTIMTNKKPRCGPMHVEPDLPPAATAARIEPEVEQVINHLDLQGRWTEGGKIRSASFISNIELLSRYLAATRSPDRAPAASCSVVLAES